MKSRSVICESILLIGPWLFPNQVRADQAFTYPRITEPILSATFNADFAALVANPTVSGFQANTVQLLGLGQPPVDLSDAFFGTVPFPGAPRINLGPLQTKIVSADIPASFFPALATGSVGYSLLFTQTGDDGLFAMTFISLSITTTSGVINAFIGPNDGFGIGIPANGDLPAPLPISIGIGVTGTGFDEAITSKALTASPIPEPQTAVLLGSSLLLLLLVRMRRFGTAWTMPLLLLCGGLSTKNLLAKTVVCVDAGNNGFNNDHEGYERASGVPDADIHKGDNTAKSLTDCLALLANGDTLVIIAHGFGEGGGFMWGGTNYTGFGSGEGQIPVPPGFDKLDDKVKVKFCSCWSTRAQAGGDNSLLDRIKKAMGGTVTKDDSGFNDFANSGSGFVNKNPMATKEQKAAALACLAADTSWKNNPPANRPGTGGPGQPDNQLSAAQKIVDKCDGAGGAVKLQIGYPKPVNSTTCGQDSGGCSLEDCAQAPFSLLGPLNQLHIVGPVPNQFPVGSASSILATVESAFLDIEEMGVPAQTVVFTKLLGDFNFTNGDISVDGKTTSLTTDINGQATVTFVPNQRGLSFITVTVDGTTLTTYSLFRVN